MLNLRMIKSKGESQFLLKLISRNKVKQPKAFSKGPSSYEVSSDVLTITTWSFIPQLRVGRKGEITED